MIVILGAYGTLGIIFIEFHAWSVDEYLSSLSGAILEFRYKIVILSQLWLFLVLLALD